MIALSTDKLILTSNRNYKGFVGIYSLQIELLREDNNLSIVCRTLGSSENIINAIKIGHAKSIYKIALLGKLSGRAIDLVNLGSIIPSQKTCGLQEVHFFILHLICELYKKD